MEFSMELFKEVEIIKGRGEFHPITGHEDPEGE
jgi:hypothetical protein